MLNAWRPISFPCSQYTRDFNNICESRGSLDIIWVLLGMVFKPWATRSGLSFRAKTVYGRSLILWVYRWRSIIITCLCFHVNVWSVDIGYNRWLGKNLLLRWRLLTTFLINLRQWNILLYLLLPRAFHLLFRKLIFISRLSIRTLLQFKLWLKRWT